MPKLERRHYKLIAAIIASLPDTASKLLVAHHFGKLLASTNPNFDYDRFIAACGV
jgi:hypothetical protein